MLEDRTEPAHYLCALMHVHVCVFWGGRGGGWRSYRKLHKGFSEDIGVLFSEMFGSIISIASSFSNVDILCNCFM